MRICVLILLMIFPEVISTAYGNVYPYHFKTPVRKGDGVISLLRRYKLENYSCNHESFYRLNQMDRNTPLHADRKYIVPISIYKYNYESIRSTINIDDWDLARKIADYNRQLLKDGIRKSTYVKSGILWVPHHLLECVEDRMKVMSGTLVTNGESVGKRNENSEPETVAVKKVTTSVSLFGEADAEVEIKSTKLKNKIYYLISGHGGPDPGAMGVRMKNSLCEDEYAYDVTLRLARNLIAEGATVHIIIQDPDDGIRKGEYLDCDRDELLLGRHKIPLRQVSRLKQRTDAVNTLYRQHKKDGLHDHTVVAIHVDSRGAHKRQDVFFYHFGESNSGKRLALDLHSTFKQKYSIHRSSGEYHGSVSARNLYVLKNTDPTAVFVELANIRNATDQKRIIKVNNRQALADWLFEGLTKRYSR